MSRETIYFISDAHFGIDLQNFSNREALFLQFLKSIRYDAESIYIVGDLFDFWIEYDYAVRPDYFLIIHELRKLVEEGITVHYFAGNHDFALGPFLEKTVGVQIHHDSYETVIQNKRVHIFHGDGLIRRDWGYRFLRSVLRNPLLQRMYKMLHPDIGIRLASFFSGSSRKFHSRMRLAGVVKEYREHAHDRLKKGNDIVIFGHTHCCELVKFEEGVYCNTGAWLKHFNYATMKNGQMTLWKYNEDSTAQMLFPKD